MPIPFRDQDDVEELGTAAYLQLEALPDRSGYRGALFQINARGEPVEFSYNRVETPSTFLWRQDDIRRAALRKLTASLLEICPRVPTLILCRADETPPELFSQDLLVTLPVCRVAGMDEILHAGSPEVAEALAELAKPLHLFWFPAPPAEGTIERALIQQLMLHGLLLEPFERASIGLAELYGEFEPAMS